MRIGILGAGAIGRYLAARLEAAGADATLVARGAQLEAIQTRGIRIIGHQALEVRPRVVSSAERAGACDLVIGCVKAYSLPGAVGGIAQMMGKQGRWLCIVNGIPWWYGAGATGALAGVGLASVDPGGRIAAAVPPSRVLGAVAYLRCAVPGPAIVEFTGGTGLVIGAAEGPLPAIAAEAARTLSVAGVPTRTTGDIRTAVWNKLFGNVALNPLSAVTGLTVDRLLAMPEHRAVLAAVGAETARLAEAVGCRPEGSVEDRLGAMETLGAFRTSMLQDADAGRPLELSAIIDAVVEIARRVGIPLPTTERLAAEARAFAQARGLSA
jgi:2-dehydropantoate 2-reductase